MIVSRRIGLVAAVALTALLVLPGLAMWRLARVLGPVEVIGYFLLISGLTYWFYRDDKRCARQGKRRTPETLLHFAEALGGWPGAFLAQRMLRHKIVKIRYQIVFWIIVAAHQAAALDFVRDWRFSKNVLSHWFV